MLNKATIWKYVTLSIFFSHTLSSSKAPSFIAPHENDLIAHIKKSIDQAEQGTSKLSSPILAVEGMTSHKTKHFLNNICSLPGCTYLEIGVWKGATFTAALYNNSNNIQQAVAIDNWSEFGSPYQEFQKNCAAFISEVNYQFYPCDSFTINTEGLCNSPIDIYFYDGNHTPEAHEQAFTYFNKQFASTFIAIVDDWNEPSVKSGTKKAFEKLNYTILFEQILPARFNCDTDLWWNGIYVAVIRRDNKNTIETQNSRAVPE